MKKLILIATIFLWLYSTATYAYEPIRSDSNVSYELSQKLLWYLQWKQRSASAYQWLTQWITNALSKVVDNPQYSYIMNIAKQTLWDVYEKSKNTRYFASLKSFRNQYDDTMQTSYDQPTNLAQCFAHYSLVNEYARRTNKPTPLILAMWYMESSCAMSNPSNRDWLFQIVNNDYEPGDIDTAWLQDQLDDFAIFMDRKWTRYYSKNPTAPHDLSYTWFTYDAIQTFSALYNGYYVDAWFTRYPLLNGSSYYFLGNSNADYKGKRDWLLLFFIKLSKMEEEYFGK